MCRYNKVTRMSVYYKGGYKMNRKLLQNRHYVFLISAQTVSNLGDWLNILALMALLALKWEASPMALSIAMLCLAVPNIFVGSLAGVIADRLNRKYLMIATDILRALVVIGIIFSSHIWQVYILLCLSAIFSAIFQPAKEGKLREMVGDDLIQPAVATSELINNGAKIIGPMISGVLVSTLGINWSFYLDSASFVLSACLLLFIPGKKLIETESQEEHASVQKSRFWAQFTDGFTFIKKQPKLMAGLFVFSVIIMVLQICDSQFAILLREIPDQPIMLLGWLMAGSGVGTVIAAIFLNKKDIQSALIALSLGSIVLGVGYILCVAFIHIPLTLIMISYPILGAVVGFCFGMGAIQFNVMAQKITPNHFTGRVFGTIGSVTTLAVVIGMLSGGVISETLGVQVTYYLSGGLLVLVGLFVYISHRRIEGGDQVAKGDSGAQKKAQG